MTRGRLSAAASLGCFAAAVLLAVAEAVTDFPRGLVAVVLVGAAVVVAWQAVGRRRGARSLAFAAAAVLLVAGVATLLSGERVLGLIATGFVALSVVFARRAFSGHVVLPVAEPPEHPILIWNPRSGGGKAMANNLAIEAEARGITPIELKPGDDLVHVVRVAVAAGADALGAAGGDGTQALVAGIAAEHDLPFACIPAGTRNHFALDLGVDRDDVVGALDALVNGRERRVDLAELNGRVFVNNVSLGLYGEAVQRQGYRDAKLRTILDTAADAFGPEPGASPSDLGWSGPDGKAQTSAAVILVSNNPYRLGRALGSGMRPRLDSGALGVAVLGSPSGRRRGAWQQWSAPTFEVTSAAPVHAGVDGEPLTLTSSLQFAILPGALRVRIAPNHPGASPAAGVPDGLLPVLRSLIEVAAGGPQPGRVEQFLARPRRAVGSASVLLALVLVSAVLIPAGPLALDGRWSELMRDAQTPFLTQVALLFNALGHGLLRGLTLAMVGVLLLWARRWWAFTAFALAEAVTPLLVNAIKLVVGRPRPPGSMIEAHGSSFPSGHAAYAGATAIALTLLFSKPSRPPVRRFAGAALLMAGMAWSRTYLQVHWLSDVLAGASLGLAVSLVVFGLLQISGLRQGTWAGEALRTLRVRPTDAANHARRVMPLPPGRA